MKLFPWTRSAMWDQYSQISNTWGGISDPFWFWCIVSDVMCLRANKDFIPQNGTFYISHPREDPSLCCCPIFEPHLTANIIRVNQVLCQQLVSTQGVGLSIQRADIASARASFSPQRLIEIMKAEKTVLCIEDQLLFVRLSSFRVSLQVWIKITDFRECCKVQSFPYTPINLKTNKHYYINEVTLVFIWPVSKPPENSVSHCMFSYFSVNTFQYDPQKLLQGTSLLSHPFDVEICITEMLQGWK